MGTQKLRGQSDELSFAPSVLYGTFKDNIVSDQVLPVVPMCIKGRVIALDDVLCICLHARIDLARHRAPSVPPASGARCAATATEEVAFGAGWRQRGGARIRRFGFALAPESPEQIGTGGVKRVIV